MKIRRFFHCREIIRVVVGQLPKIKNRFSGNDHDVLCDTSYRLRIRLSSITSSRPQSSPALSELGCWNFETLVPWKEVVATVAVGLWSMLSITDAVNNPFF